MLLSVSVVIALRRRLVSWSIIEAAEVDLTFEMLFEEIKSGKFDCVPLSEDLRRARLLQVAVGNSRDTLMTTSPTQSVINVCESFGKYLKYTVEINLLVSIATSSTTGVATGSAVVLRNAFQVLMAAQRQKQSGDNGLPFAVQEKNSKDRLYNDLISLMKELDVKWNDPETHGEPFLRKLCDILWYLDGHHGTIAEHSPKIPELFSKFVGYNCPELHKHHKRTHCNLRSTDLHSYSMMLLDILHTSWIKKDVYQMLQEAVEGLMKSLKSHATYLNDKSKYQRLHHLADHPSATPEDSSYTKYLIKSRHSVSAKLLPLQSALESSTVYTPLSLIEYAPGDRKQRYK